MRLVRLGLFGALALAAAVVPVRSAPAPAGPAMRTIDITVHYSQFSPATVSVPMGATVRLRIRNTDPIDHEFILGDASRQAREETGTDLVHNGMVPGEVSVPAGTTQETVVTFSRSTPGLSPSGGSLAYACHLPGHYAYGMRGVLRVTA